MRFVLFCPVDVLAQQFTAKVVGKAPIISPINLIRECSAVVLLKR